MGEFSAVTFLKHKIIIYKTINKNVPSQITEQKFSKTGNGR